MFQVTLSLVEAFVYSMTLYMYAYRNTNGNFFGAPFNTGDDVDVTAEKYARLCFAADDKQLNSLVDDELWLIGTFDDVTGVVTPKHEFVINVGSIVSQVLAARAGGVANGSKESKE